MSERSIYPPKKYKDMMDGLKKNSKLDTRKAPFKTLAHVMAFAAAVGAATNPESFNTEFSRAKDPIGYDIFENYDFDTLIGVLAIHKEGDLNVLTSENNGDEKIKIFEGYAYAGLEKIESVLSQGGALAVDQLLHFLSRHIDDTDPKSIDLTDYI